MRQTFPIALIFALVFMATPAAQAGVYNTAEPDEGPLDPNYLGKFRDTLLVLKTIAAPQVQVERPLRKRYVLQADLFNTVDVAKLSAEQKLNFSAALIRRNRIADAIGLLIGATRQHPDVFLLQSNLATAYHLNGDKGRARDTMADCLDRWPKDWKELSKSQQELLATLGWTPQPNDRDPKREPFVFHRDAEVYYLKLLKLRSREPKGADVNFESVDALFDVNFVGESGQFEPGKISKAEKAKLPREALDIVEQLLVWMPHDLRLFWLLGEVLNVQGDVESVKGARNIFDDLVYTYNVRAKSAMERRQILNNWTPPLQDDDQEKKVAPTPALDWRSLSIAFGVGVVVAFFARWQIQEIRRRMQKS